MFLSFENPVQLYTGKFSVEYYIQLSINLIFSLELFCIK